MSGFSLPALFFFFLILVFYCLSVGLPDMSYRGVSSNVCLGLSTRFATFWHCHLAERNSFSMFFTSPLSDLMNGGM
jgi:hypothetical protein